MYGDYHETRKDSWRALFCAPLECANEHAQNHRTKALAAKLGWASRCGHVLYISADADDSLPTEVIPNSEEGSIINEKVLQGFERLYARFPSAKWYIKADDDSFVQLDHLAQLLARYDHTEPHYIGRAGLYSGIQYCGGGASYVLSHATLRDWVPHLPQCRRLPVGEDVSVGYAVTALFNTSPFLTYFPHFLVCV